jgi:hypothetical protein
MRDELDVEFDFLSNELKFGGCFLLLLFDLLNFVLIFGDCLLTCLNDDELSP